MASTNTQMEEISSRDDRILLETRILAVIIVPILLAAFWMLNLSSDSLHENFAWGISPIMSAMMLGSAYLGGSYFFTRVALSKRWHIVKLGLLPVTTFASFLGIATLLHWDKFHHELFAFQLWAFLYLTLPFVLVIVWFRNRNTDPNRSDTNYPPLPQYALWFFYTLGILLTLVALLLMIVPQVMIPTWPWTLSPLTARTMAALFILPGLVSIGIARDTRWSSAKIILESQMVALISILISLLRSQANFDWSQFVAWLFTGSMVALCLVLFFLYIWMERHRSQS